MMGDECCFLCKGVECGGISWQKKKIDTIFEKLVGNLACENLENVELSARILVKTSLRKMDLCLAYLCKYLESIEKGSI